MPRNKLVYGKRPKDSSRFASSTAFAWSSPQKPVTTVHSDNAIEVAISEVTEAVNNLQIGEKSKGGAKAVKKNDRALQTKDANVVLQPGLRHKDGKDEKPPKSTASKNRHDSQKPEDQSTEEDAGQENEEARQMRDPLPIRKRAPEHKEETCVTAPEQDSSTPLLALPETPPLDPLISYTQPLLRLCSDRTARKAPVSFSAWSTSLEQHFHILKIAEASYGEVYRLSLQAPIPDLTRSDESVLKIIALKPPPSRPVPKNAEKKTAMMSTISQVTSEVQLLQRMTPIPGFTNFRDIRILQGRPPPAFCTAWKRFNKSRRKSQKSIFPDPSRKGSYDDEQLWAVIEMQDAGTDLERLIEEGTETIGGIWGVWDIFWGVVLALGKGEESCRFEHRDLHLGNVCVRPTHAASDSVVAAPRMRHLDRKFGFTGLETTIIDYTLSRADMDTTATLPNGTISPQIAYSDLEADQALFEGDGELEYQYDMYRFMRAYMYLDDPLADLDARWGEAEKSGRTWEAYHSQTNLVWLHYILHMMLEVVVWPSSEEIGALGSLDANVDEVAAARKAREIEKVLLRLQDVLDPGQLPKSGLRSAKDLVGMALREGWLDEGDVIGSAADISVVAPEQKLKKKTAKKVKGRQPRRTDAA